MPDALESSPMSVLSVSVIIPVLNEAARLGPLLARLLSDPSLHEVIVVDGGSHDGSPEIAAAHPGVKLLRASRGRAVQMNTGARAATGDVLLFLHADVTLPPRASSWIRRTLDDANVVGGAFRTWTVIDDREPRFWHLALHIADVRSRCTRYPYGDQAVFVRSAIFDRIGGFPEIELMEDLAFSQRLNAVGRVVTVPASVTVSGRRFLARPIFYTIAMNVFPLLYRLGVSPKTLSTLYGHVR